MSFTAPFHSINYGRSKYNFSPSCNTLVCALSSAPTSCSSELGPLVDDGAPFCAIGDVELHALRKSLYKAKFVIDDKHQELAEFDYYQYAVGSHASSRLHIIGSVVLHATTNCRASVAIRHLVIEGSSQWVLGRNLTRTFNLVHIVRHSIDLPVTPVNSIDMIDHGRPSCVEVSRFAPLSKNAITSLDAYSEQIAAEAPHSPLPTVRLTLSYNIYRSGLQFLAWSTAYTVTSRVWTRDIQ